MMVESNKGETRRCDWKSALSEEYCCQVPATHGNLCVLHFEKDGTANQDLDAFMNRILDQIDGGAHELNASIDFRGYSFPGDVVVGDDPAGKDDDPRTTYLPSTANLILNEVIVGGSVRVFGDVKTPPNVTMVKARIAGDLRCKGRIGSLVIRGAEVGGMVDLHGGRVDGDLDGVLVSIAGDLILTGAEVKGDVVLSEADVKGDINLMNASFTGGVDARRCKIRKTLVLRGAAFDGVTLFRGCVPGEIWLGEGYPHLWGTRHVWGTKRTGLLRQKHWASGASLWFVIRAAFERNGARDTADRAYYFERMWTWRGRLSSGNLLSRFFALLLYPLDVLLLRWPTAYGGSFWRVLGSWVGTITGFAIAYYTLASQDFGAIFDSLSTGISAESLSLGRTVYYSIVTFTTLGYGDIRPAPGLGSVLASAESILGALLIALTILVVGKRFLR